MQSKCVVLIVYTKNNLILWNRIIPPPQKNSKSFSFFFFKRRESLYRETHLCNLYDIFRLMRPPYRPIEPYNYAFVLLDETFNKWNVSKERNTKSKLFLFVLRDLFDFSLFSLSQALGLANKRERKRKKYQNLHTQFSCFPRMHPWFWMEAGTRQQPFVFIYI